MGAATVPVDELVRSTLARASVAGLYVTIPEPVDPADFDRVRQALQALGGTWSRGRGYRFASDPRPVLAAAVATSRVPAPRRVTEGYVRTPAPLARDLAGRYAGLAGSRPGIRVLEPSAGDGPLVAAVLAANPAAAVVALEPNANRAAAIPRDERVTVVTTTLETYATTTPGGQFDVVVMNPPFAVPGHPALWIDHVRTAWGMLAPGGRLVAVVPSTFAHGGDRRTAALRELIADHGGTGALPPGAFAASGTDVHACVVWADRPDPAAPGPPYVFRTYTGREVPVRVGQPQVGCGAPPVQVWSGGWTAGRDRVLRFYARCALCPRRLWGFDDADDPRGILGYHCVEWSLDPEHHDAVGPEIGLCSECANDRGYERHEAGMRVARRHWTAAGRDGEAAPDTPPAAGHSVQLSLLDAL